MKKIWIVFRLFRVPNLLLLALTMVMVRYGILDPILSTRGLDPQMPLLDFILLVLSAVLLAAGGYIINDYYDLRIDEINRPEKLVLHVHIPLKNAIFLYYVLTIAGCALGIWLSYTAGSLRLGFIHIVIALVLYYYSLKYKRLPFAGNIAVALLAALSILLVWLFEFFYIKENVLVFAEMIGYFSSINIMVLAYASFALLVTLIREIVKDVEDIEGDRAQGCRTLPIAFGVAPVKRWLIILTGLTMLLIAFSVYKLFSWDFGVVCWYTLVVMGLLWAYFLMKLIGAKEKSDYHFLSGILKIVILAGILSMQLLYLTF